MPKKTQHKVRIVVASLIRKDEKYLLVSEGNKKGGLWSPPQGKLDRGENILEAMVREVKEETNLDFKPSKIIAPIIVREHSKRGVISLKFFIEGSWRGLPKPSGEVEKIAFFTENEIRKLKLRTPEMRRYLGKIESERLLPLNILHTFITDKH